MKDQLSCSKCNYAAGDDVARCPECGSWMRRAQGIRRRGWALIVIGVLLVAMMGTITFMVAPTMLSGGASGGGQVHWDAGAGNTHIGTVWPDHGLRADCHREWPV